MFVYKLGFFAIFQSMKYNAKFPYGISACPPIAADTFFRRLSPWPFWLDSRQKVWLFLSSRWCYYLIRRGVGKAEILRRIVQTLEVVSFRSVCMRSCSVFFFSCSCAFFSTPSWQQLIRHRCDAQFLLRQQGWHQIIILISNGRLWSTMPFQVNLPHHCLFFRIFHQDILTQFMFMHHPLWLFALLHQISCFLLLESQILNLIESQGCLGFIEGSIPQSPPTDNVFVADAADQIVSNSAFLAWQRTDKLIKGWIIGTLNEEILRQAIGLNTAHDV